MLDITGSSDGKTLWEDSVWLWQNHLLLHRVRELMEQWRIPSSWSCTHNWPNTSQERDGMMELIASLRAYSSSLRQACGNAALTTVPSAESYGPRERRWKVPLPSWTVCLSAPGQTGGRISSRHEAGDDGGLENSAVRS